MLDAEKSAILETSVIAYDALFSELGPDARASFRDTVQTYLESGVSIPEVKSVSKATNYSNWNFNLVNSLKAKIAGNDLTGEEEGENQAAELAQFIAKDLKIVGKLVAAVEQQYSAGALADTNENLINSIKGTVINDISKLQSELDLLTDQFARYNDPQHVDYDTQLAQATNRKLQTTTELRNTAEDLQATLGNFNKGDDVSAYVSEHGDYLQLRIDALELARQEKLAEYKQYTAENHTGSADLANAAKFELEVLSRESLDFVSEKQKLDGFEQYDSTLRTASVKAGVNLLSTAQASAAFAVKPENTVDGHVTNAGFLGEAILSAGGDILDAAGHLKFAKGAKGFAALSLVGGAAGSFVPTAKLLADPDLPPETRRIVEAEVGLQGTALAFGAVENVLGIAELAVKAGSKAANVLGKAVPIIGAIGSVVGAINPAKWSEFDQKQDRIDAIRSSDTYSSGLLGDLLQESKDAEAAFYGVTTGLDVATGVTSGVLAATGVGAPIAALVGLIGGAISAIVGAFEQVALEDIADKYAQKIRTDADGNEQSVEEFFDGSFDQKQEKTKAHYFDFFSDLVAEDEIDQVIALGGQGLDVTDVELAAISKTSGELNKTAKNYIETFTSNGWQTGDRSLTPTPGSDLNVIQLANASGAKSYLTFTTPLFAAGNEETSREETGKNAYQTTLKITDLSGWEIRDFGDNQTTFNLSKVVSSAQDRFGSSKEIDIEIKAAGGDDTLFAYEAQTRFDGGSGRDTASYARLSGTELDSGLGVHATGADTLIVGKHLNAGSKHYKESIDSQTTNHGKRTEVVQFRKVGLKERSDDHSVVDELSNIEILHGSSLGDRINVDLSTQVEQVFGFGGDDQITVGDSIEIVGGGAGNDAITLTHSLLTKYWSGEKSELYIDGSDGDGDTLVIAHESLTRLRDELETDAIRQQTAEEIAETLIPVVSADRATEVAKTSDSLAEILRNSDSDALRELTVLNTEKVHIDLGGAGPGGDVVAHSLSTYRDAVNNAITNINSDNSTSELDLSVSAYQSADAVVLLGTAHNDTITGSNHNDYLFGAAGNDVFNLDGVYDGNDILVGGEGKDVYNFDFQGEQWTTGHHLITGPEAEDMRGDVLNIRAYDSVSLWYYQFQDDLVITLGKDSSFTVADYFGADHADTRLTSTRQNSLQHEDVGSILANAGYSDSFHVNVVFAGASGIGIYQNSLGSFDDATLTSQNHYFDEFRASYLGFRNSDDVWATHRDDASGANFSDELGKAIDARSGGAILSRGGEVQLEKMFNIKDASRGETRGNASNNTLAGTVGDDFIFGENGADAINGLAGDDIIHGGLGLDNLDGGGGFDIASYEGASFAIKYDLRGSQSEYYRSGGRWLDGDAVANFEGVIGTGLSDELIGNADANYLEGGSGADTISGNGGNDVIHGGGGLDVLDGGAGFDVASYKGAGFAIRFDLASSDPGYDQREQYQFGGQWLQGDMVDNFEGVIGTGLADSLFGNGGGNYFDGGAGNDQIDGRGGDDTIFGGEGTDTLEGAEGFDILSYEGQGDAVRIRLTDQTSERMSASGSYVTGDVISGFEGVIGTSQNDELYGNDQGNRLEGGGGADRLVGGAGFDSFVFRENHGHDLIEDFTVGEDKLLFDFAGSVDTFDIFVVETPGSALTATRIVSDDGGVIDLLGVEVDELGANSFVFV